MNKRMWIFVLAAVLMLALAACGQSDNEAPVTTEAPTATTAPTPTTEPTPTATMAPTATAALVETEQEEPVVTETVPTLQELLAFNADMQNLSRNYKADIKLAFAAEFEGDGFTAELSMKMLGETLSYENVSYSDTSVDMSFFGVEEKTNEKQYIVIDEENNTSTEYTFSAEDDAWYKTESGYFGDGALDNSMMGDFSNMDTDEFSVVETTTDDENIYITATVSPDLDLEAMDMFSELGLEDMEFGISCNFVFDKETHAFVSMELICEYSDLISEELKENGVKSISIDEFVIKFMSNTTPVSVPEDVIANALEEDDYDWNIDTDEEESIHEGWGSWYNGYCEETGEFPMYYNGEEIKVSLNGQENWYFDNSLSTIAQLAVRDDSVSDYGPAYEVSYSNSWCMVDGDMQSAKDYLMEYDFEGTHTDDEIVPLVVNGKQCFCFVAYETEFYRSINILQDIGFDEYVEISISTDDVETDVLELAGKFMLNFVYDGE